MAKVQTQMFLATIVFIALLLVPLWFATVVAADEQDKFSVGGLSLETVRGIEETADLGEKVVIEAFPSNNDRSSFSWLCTDAVNSYVEGSDSSVTNITTNLTFFGDSYASVVIDTRAKVGDVATFTSPPQIDDTCAIIIFLETTRQEFVESEVLTWVVHTSPNSTVKGSQIFVRQYFDAVVECSVEIGELSDSEEHESGTVQQLLLSTQDRLEVEGACDEVLPVGRNFVVELVIFIDLPDQPQEGDLVIYDMELQKTREGLLTNSGRLITFNVIYAIITGIAVVIATPFVSAKDIFGRLRRGRRGDTGGQVSTITIVLLVLVALVAALFIFGTSGSLADAFKVGFLPLTLAVGAISIVAFVMRGKSNRGGTLLVAALAGVFGWAVGLAVQNSWLAYDEVFVAPFVEVATGMASASSVFEITAFFVVLVQIFGLLVAAFNLAQTLFTDDVISAVQ